MGKRIKITDAGAATSYKVNSPAGEYGILVAETSFDGDSTLSTPLIHGETISGQTVTSTKPAVGLLFYQAGVAVLNKSILNSTSSAATATITFTGDPTPNETIAITSTDGTTITYSAKTSGNASANTFDCNNGVVTSGTELAAAINHANGHSGKITAVHDGSGVVTLTQVVKGDAGNTAITSGLSNTTVTNFLGGGSDGILDASIGAPLMNSSRHSFDTMLKNSEISSSADALRNRIFNLQFNNTVELNSTVHFCRIKHNEV